MTIAARLTYSPDQGRLKAKFDFVCSGRNLNTAHDIIAAQQGFRFAVDCDLPCGSNLSLSNNMEGASALARRTIRFGA